MYDLVERYLKKLDTELLKFKCELEADHHGITDVLEKRSLELDGSSSIPSQKENRYFGSISQNQNRSLSERYRVKPEKRRDSSSTVSTPTTEKRHTLTASLSTPTARPSTPNIPHQVLQTTPTVSYTGNATIIAAAAAQAIEKTQQMQQGRRTASLKASYEAIHGSGGSSSIPHELLIGRDLTGTHPLQSMDRDVSFTAATTPGGSSNNPKRHKKKVASSTMPLPSSHPAQSSSSSSASASANANALLHQLQQTHSNDSDEMPSVYINDSGMVVEQTPEGEWVYDPNEPRYCICNQVSYGEMVACDNEDVISCYTDQLHKILINSLFFYYSVPWNGFIIHALTSHHHQRVNGIALNVHVHVI